MSKGTGLSAERENLRSALHELADKALRGTDRTAAIKEANRRRKNKDLPPVRPTTVGGWFENGIPAKDFEDLWALVEVLLERSGQLPRPGPLNRPDPAQARAAREVNTRRWKILWEQAKDSRPASAPPAGSNTAPLTRHLHAYLRAAVRAARQHPYPGVLPGTTPPLTTVYLSQKTARRAEETVGRGLGGEDRVRQEHGVLAEARPAAQVLAEHHTCVVLAGPGGGKSSLLRTHLTHICQRWLTDHKDPAVPVLVTAADLEQSPLAPALASAVNTQLAPHGLTEELPTEFFRTPPQPGTQWLVLVDGLDEVTDPAARRRVLRTVATLAEDEHAGLYRFVVATRPLPSGELDPLGDKWPRHDLLPFTVDQLPDVANGWFRAAGMDNARDAAERFVQDLERAGLTGLARVPLMASMLCQLHAADPDRPLPRVRGQLYRDFTDLLHKHQYASSAQKHAQACGGMERYGHNARQQAEHVLDHLHDLIAHLAAERHSGNGSPALDIVQSCPEALCPPRVPRDQWREFLDTALRRSGLLTVRAGELVFLHQTLLEYMAARHATRNPRNRADTLRWVLYRPARYRSFSKVPGVKPRMWFSRYWQAPPSYGASRSYIGFLLDTAHEADPRAADVYLTRMASRRSGLHGSEFIASQVLLGTFIPPHTIRAAADVLHSLAATTALDGFARVAAVRALANLGDPRAVDVLHALATTASSDGYQVEAVRALANLGGPRAADVLHTLATTLALDGFARVEAARALADLGDPRAVDVLHTLATTAFEGHDRLEAARALADLGDPRAANTWHKIAATTTLFSSARVEAAWALADLGDPRAANTWRKIATTASSDGYRVVAARALADLGDPRAAKLLHMAD